MEQPYSGVTLFHCYVCLLSVLELSKQTHICVSVRVCLSVLELSMQTDLPKSLWKPLAGLWGRRLLASVSAFFRLCHRPRRGHLSSVISSHSTPEWLLLKTPNTRVLLTQYSVLRQTSLISLRFAPEWLLVKHKIPESLVKYGILCTTAHVCVVKYKIPECDRKD